MEKVPFSFDWFLTVPGILISVGVVLLIISLILFIVSSMKEKKESVPSVLEDNKETSTTEETSVVEEVKTEVEPQEEIQLIDAVSEEVVVPSFEGDEVNAIDEVIPMDEAEMEEVQFVADEEPATIKTTPVVEEVVEIEETPVVEEEIKTEEIPQEEVTIVEEENETPSIYGGADPLEATQNLPKMDVHHEPYSGGSVEATIVDEVPTEEPTIIEETPVVEEQPVEVEIPEVVAIPDEEIEDL